MSAARNADVERGGPDNENRGLATRLKSNRAASLQRLESQRSCDPCMAIQPLERALRHPVPIVIDRDDVATAFYPLDPLFG